MGELGENEIALHREVGAHAASCGIDVCICAGALCEHMAQAAREARTDLEVIYEPDREESSCTSGRICAGGDTILVKASHFMKFEEVLKKLQEM